MPQSVLERTPTLEFQQSLILITDSNGLRKWKTRRDLKKYLYTIFPDCKREIREAFSCGRTTLKATEEEKDSAFEEFRAKLLKYCRVLKPGELKSADCQISQPSKNTLYAKLPSALGTKGYIPLQAYIEDYWKVFHNLLVFRLIQLGAKRIELHVDHQVEKVLGIKSKARYEKFGGGADYRSREASRQLIKHTLEFEKPSVPKHEVTSNFTQLDVTSHGAEIIIDGFLAVRERVYGGRQRLDIDVWKQMEKYLGVSLFAWLLELCGEWNFKKEESFKCSIDVTFFSEEEYV